MVAPPRPGMPGKKYSSMRPPSFRPTNSRSQSSTPAPTGRASPADSIASTGASRTRSPAIAGTKRKEREFENDAAIETNINVVVRCRGRSDREVKENSGVVVSANGIKGNSLVLSMGPSALSNKTYHFDKVFSHAADQCTIYDEVVAPILDEVLEGFNCTIFAYGQTGTGKTYTMSGDISTILPLPDSAGIIPRVLYSLFAKLDGGDHENAVKCSFIELYNEELRDLLSVEEGSKLKIYEDNSRKSHHGTLVQGMEETYIKSAAEGIQRLQSGSHKRQVAATKCNDLSSRSHTIFTITVLIKRPSDTGGEDYLCTGKLNLVDLAGSENIQRSGAENKRATEAGLINKSLLTLGRVINALVEKGSHIPYRESKLTRLLQDSLGGRTKTCIIATLSPAKSNLEETISTLDYAFRAKNIRNKPQHNQTISKWTMLKDYTSEIEKLKSELIAARQRNGVYLTPESYEALTTENESRRLLSEEQRDKIETVESHLRNKVQELFSLITNFNTLKRDNDATRLHLEETKGILEKTDIVLAHTRQSLAEENLLRKAHQKTEEELANIGQNMISTLGKTTSDLGGLHAKLRRRSALQSQNRDNWTSTQARVGDKTRMVEERLSEFQSQQEILLSDLSTRMQGFVEQELQKLESSKAFMQEKMLRFQASEKEVNEQTAKSKDELNGVLQEIKLLREDVKQKVGAGLNDLSAAAQRISAGISEELKEFQAQLHISYSSMGKEFKNSYQDLIERLDDQQAISDQLQQQIVKADQTLVESSKSAQQQLSVVVEEERIKAVEERQLLMSQIASLVNTSAEAQEARISNKLSVVQESMRSANGRYGTEHDAWNSGMDMWKDKSKEIVFDIIKSRDNIKAKVVADYAAANTHTASLQSTTTSVHDSTVQIVDTQMAHMDTQLQSLDDIVVRIREQNDSHNNTHSLSLAALGDTVQSSYASIEDHLASTFSRVQELDGDVTARMSAIRHTFPLLSADGDIRATLHGLREEIETQTLVEYAPTGETPQRIQYSYPSTLPRTEGHDNLLARLRGPPVSDSPLSEPARSPTKTRVFADAPSSSPTESRPPTSGGILPASTNGLREIDANVVKAQESHFGVSVSSLEAAAMPPLKRQNTNTSGLDKSIGVESKLPSVGKRKNTRMTVASVGMGDRENQIPLVENLSASVGPRPGSGRRLRSRDNV
ncbi:kinesin family protein-like protein [Pseudovirgaria hyperparasitica]|uniref:Kinesin family protein-like protein n=1 Tax=Pseudovirgaria hyperparasitica TaxID=470096 RepID=A0A6A6VSJ1_9PEZI|nr:kinesin family protein-like protein [Pseudovirgaria hyperparasitica]KAF2752724.1 kinesin family protein-like protein [Pseudovirgaria hyperparasitica]